MKRYTLQTEDIETMLQEKYGDKIEPVNQAKLLQQKRQQQRANQMGNIFKKTEEKQ